MRSEYTFINSSILYKRCQWRRNKLIGRVVPGLMNDATLLQIEDLIRRIVIYRVTGSATEYVSFERFG